jgi:hypothetical protein
MPGQITCNSLNKSPQIDATVAHRAFSSDAEELTRPSGVVGVRMGKPAIANTARSLSGAAERR